MRRLFWFAPVLGALGMTTLLVTQNLSSAPANAGKDLKAISSLPISRVILFSSGVGHFSRSAEVEGDARVDLTFPEQDVNDLIKSMTLRDYSEKGRVTAVTYDSHDPIDRTLRSFAIDLNNNPSFGQILNQARGEAVEVVLNQNASGQPGTVQGKVIGLEIQKHPSKDGPSDVEVLNLWCTEGVRAIKLAEVQRLRFVNPRLENEMRRALETLAQSHDSQKKAVSLHFSGEGKRKVEVGYVIENPVWKTSYRLVLDKENKQPPYLQGWAVVENPTDEDWNAVQVALVSGRPISFQMDLYNPLYVHRPVVEPELFASLRPPTYSGALARNPNTGKLDFEEAERETGAMGGGPGAAAAVAIPATIAKYLGTYLTRRAIRQLEDTIRAESPIGAPIAAQNAAQQQGLGAAAGAGVLRSGLAAGADSPLAQSGQ